MFSFLRSGGGLSARGHEALKKEKAIERCFQTIASNCKERKQQLKTMCTVSSHTTLKSIMSSLGIDVTKPLEQVYGQCQQLIDFDDQPGIKEFAKQWKAYVQYLYGAKANQE